MPGFKVSEDRLTFLLGMKTSGDFKFKLVLTFHSESPKALMLN